VPRPQQTATNIILILSLNTEGSGWGKKTSEYIPCPKFFDMAQVYLMAPAYSSIQPDPTMSTTLTSLPGVGAWIIFPSPMYMPT
jgi:hypothetical protein